MINKTITAVVPVKANSSRLEDKNFLPFGDFETLLENKIYQLKKCDKINKILVTSDSLRAKEISKKMGVEFELRPIEYANESRPLSEFFRYVASLLENNSNMLWACVTSPLIDEDDYTKIINRYFESITKGYDSIITVTKFKHYLMDSNGPVNYKLGEGHTNSQDLPEYDLFTNGALICPVSSLIEWGYNYGPNPYRYSVPQSKSIDIDTECDYIMAKAIKSHK